MNFLPCIDECIVGIADTSCDCFNNPNNVDISKSDSGLYINDILSLVDINTLKECKDQSVFDILVKARKVGLQRYKQNLQRLITRNFRQNYRECHHVNRMYKTSIQPINHQPFFTWKGIEICGKNIPGSTMEIERIVTYFQSTGTKNLYLYSEDDLVNPIAIITVTVNSTKVINNVNDIVLKLYNECKTCNEVKYYLMYEVEETLDNRDNECDCGCGGAKCISDYAEIRGVYWNSKGDFEAGISPNRSDSYCNGIELYADFKCDYSLELCKDSEMDYEDGIGNAHAVGVLYESVKYLMEIMNTNSSLKGLYNYEKSAKKEVEDVLKSNYAYLYELLKEMKFNCLSCKGTVYHT